MNQRITLITLLEKKDLDWIATLLSSFSFPLCKVPYGQVEKRELVDTLPYHLTIYGWDIQQETEVLSFLQEFSFEPFTIELDHVELKRGALNSMVLVLSVKDDKNLKKLQEIIFKQFPSSYYNPLQFQFHLTLHIDCNFEKIIIMQKEIEKKFQPFEVEINQLGLFEIYPAKRVRSFLSSSNNNNAQI